MKFITVISIGGISGLTGVILGALGSHAFKATLEAHQRVPTWSLAVNFHLFHSLLLLIIGIWIHKQDTSSKAACLITLGILLFCGSLYAIALTGHKAYGAFAPLGGVSLMIGWVWFVWEMISESV